MSRDSNSRRLVVAAMDESGFYVDNGRNALVRKFLKTRGDYALSLDTDMDFEQDAPYQLLDDMVEHDRAISSGLYFNYLIDGKIRALWFRFGEAGEIHNVCEFNVPEVIPIDACGMGFCLIRRDVFETILKNPDYANDSWSWFGREPISFNDVAAHLGEDVSFGHRAKEAGFQAWGNSGVRARHWKKVPIDLELFRLFAEDAKRRGEEY